MAKKKANKSSKQTATEGVKAQTNKPVQAQASSESAGGISGKIAQAKQFFEESKVELKKVTWPTRKETTTTGTAVFVLVVVFSLFLGVTDLSLSKLIELILS
ncbi:preprotein translocase subunit SecE [Desulfovibrio inopinatus]|uniref:preprotein translocase subunit SecE n=1 Tax=Desulfovibrio inopinatus TaxID=102109 RepID=UPI00041D574F|nr:preprotein translocase subunit SecE [Desulfovibrio inopinatus]